MNEHRRKNRAECEECLALKHKDEEIQKLKRELYLKEKE